MKSIHDINHEIAELQAQYPSGMKDTREYEKAGKRVSLLRTCINYLELNPAVDAINHQLQLVEKKIKFANDGYQTWYDCTVAEERGKNPKQTYRT